MESAINDIKELQKKRDDLMLKLECSLTIQQIWPGARWPVSTYIAGGFQKGFYFYMSDKTGAVKRIELNKMPSVFKERAHIKRAIKHIKSNDYRREYVFLD